MNNLYLIYGEEDFLIKKELNNIIKNIDTLEDNIIKYNMEEENISVALDEACTISMFESPKIIICENSTFLTGTSKKEINHDIDSLLKYINNPFNDVYLILL